MTSAVDMFTNSKWTVDALDRGKKEGEEMQQSFFRSFLGKKSPLGTAAVFKSIEKTKKKRREKKK